MMHMNDAAPLIEPGFYYHYKHDPAGDTNVYAYEVVGTGKHTEDDSLFVLYRPLYANAWLGRATHCIRPVGMFSEAVEKAGGKPRFSRITDVETIARLTEIKNKMYPS